MGVGCNLVNYTKREVISFLHVPASKAVEITGHPAAAAITAWYLLECRGTRFHSCLTHSVTGPLERDRRRPRLLHGCHCPVHWRFDREGPRPREVRERLSEAKHADCPELPPTSTVPGPMLAHLMLSRGPEGVKRAGG